MTIIWPRTSTFGQGQTAIASPTLVRWWQTMARWNCHTKGRLFLPTWQGAGTNPKNNYVLRANRQYMNIKVISILWYFYLEFSISVWLIFFRQRTSLTLVARKWFLPSKVYPSASTNWTLPSLQFISPSEGCVVDTYMRTDCPGATTLVLLFVPCVSRIVLFVTFLPFAFRFVPYVPFVSFVPFILFLRTTHIEKLYRLYRLCRLYQY